MARALKFVRRHVTLTSIAATLLALAAELGKSPLSQALERLASASSSASLSVRQAKNAIGDQLATQGDQLSTQASNTKRSKA